MINIKKFWKDNKKEIIIGGAMIGVSVATVILTRKYYTSNFNLVPKDLSVISWKPVKGTMTIERAKATLDANVNNDSAFAIVKDGSELIGIILSDGVVTT